MTARRTPILAVAILISAIALPLRADDTGGPLEGPRFTPSGQLLRPSDYREWVWLTAGIGMAYGPNAPQTTEDPPFDNVFVNRSAYRSFLKNGMWPDGTMFVLEIRSSRSKASINRSGHFQGELRAIEAEVKWNGKWGFYGFEGQLRSAARIPGTASCYTCHAANGAVDNTFVQFYPTLIDVARTKGTFREKAGE